jgi:hypothetical protein
MKQLRILETTAQRKTALLILVVAGIVLSSVPMVAQENFYYDGATNQNFGPKSVPGTSVIFDPDHVLTRSELAALGSNGSLGATPAVRALAFNAGQHQTFTFAASGKVGCCGTVNVGPDGYSGSSNIDSLKSISGFAAPVEFPLVGVFTDGRPKGAAPPDYNYRKGVRLRTYSPRLNQVFFIGDGLTGTGSGYRQTFHVPPTATELWLGFADARGFNGPPGFYGDNPGKLRVSGTLHTPAQ